MDDDELPSDDNEDDEDDERHDASFKSFRLLNALSDLMMLPKDMLLSRSVRKEVSRTLDPFHSAACILRSDHWQPYDITFFLSLQRCAPLSVCH